MESRHVNGLPGITIAEGERLGAVTRTDLDPARQRVVGFAFDAGGGLLSPDHAPRLDAACVRTSGRDALLIEDRAAVRGDAIDRTVGSLTTLDELQGRPVLTRRGQAVGKLGDCTVDPRVLDLSEMEATAGRLTGSRSVPIGQVLAIRRDDVVGHDVLAPAPEAVGATGPSPDGPAAPA